MSAASMSAADHTLTEIARLLIPLFLGPNADQDAAHNAAQAAIAAHDPRTPADCLVVARLIVVSFASLVAAGQACSTDLPERQQLQYLSRLTALSRAAQRAETTLAKSRRRWPEEQQAREPAMPTLAVPVPPAAPQAAAPVSSPAQPRRPEPTASKAAAAPPSRAPSQAASHAVSHAAAPPKHEAIEALLGAFMPELRAITPAALAASAAPPRGTSLRASLLGQTTMGSAQGGNSAGALRR